MKTETIAAIATAVANAGIGIIKISGPEAFEVADRVFLSKAKENRVSEMDSHTVHYGYIVDGNETIDEVLLIVMRGPKTYTREDVVEIDSHGGTVVMQKILEVILKNGARAAEPGEFTKRAFLNGRIDLSQAEAVIDVINAGNDMALKSSVSQLKGSVLKKVGKIRENILHEMAFIEAALDDPEHYSLEGYIETLREQMEVARTQVHGLVLSADSGKMLKNGINTVIAGKPNVGKSTLLNALIGEERAIVTDIAGTTRDALTEQIQIRGIGLNVIDTAGIRDTEDIIEKIGVTKALSFIEDADLVIFIVDSSMKLDENDFNIIRRLRDKKAIVLLNKSDLEMKICEEDLYGLINKPVIMVSAKEGFGLDKLEQTIIDMFFDGEISFNDQVYITNARQKQALIEAEKSLGIVLEGISDGISEDFLTIDMMDAYEKLGEVIGESVGDDLVDRIFSEFCMGK